MIDIHSFPDGRVAILGQALESLIAICAHYASNGERVAGIICDPHNRGLEFNATVTRGYNLFHVKVRITNDQVHEYGREER